MSEEIKEQLKQLRRGTADVISEKELQEKLIKSAQNSKPLRIKLGLDPTSPDIHLGHTVVLRKMRQFQDMGHKAVLIIGDYTSRIGDPTGRNSTRPVLTPEQIEENAKTYFEQAGKILDTREEKLEVRRNSEWLSELKLADIIKLTGVMTVARMDSVMIQSDVELGGTDQTFNNLVGRDLQRIDNQAPQIVMTMPILVGLDGTEKMSKSKGNYIGVTDEPKDMFGKVMSIPDELMKNYFTLLTDMPEEKIAELTDASKTHPKEAKVTLGKIIVNQFYDDQAAEMAAAEFEKVFAKGQMPDDIPVVEIEAAPIMASKLLLNCKLVASGGEGKRMIKQSAVSINSEKITDPTMEITPADGMILQVGKRKFAQLKVV